MTKTEKPKLLEITEEYYEELLADRIRLAALEQVHILAQTSSWVQGVDKFWIQGKGWFSKSFYGHDVRSTIDAWIASTVESQDGS